MSKTRDSSQQSACCRWASSVPCSCLGAFLLVVTASITCTGSLFVAVIRLRDLLQQPDLIPFFLPLCIGMLAGMVVVAVIFIAISAISSRPMVSKFNSNRKNMFARVVNCFMIFLVVVLQFVWILIAILIAIFLTALLHIIALQRNRPTKFCLRTNDYGLPPTANSICGPDFKAFTDKIQEHELVLCSLIALVSAVSIIICLTFFIIVMAVSYTRLKDAHSCSQQPAPADNFQLNDSRPPNHYLPSTPE